MTTKLREPGPNLNFEPVRQRGRQPQHQTALLQADEASRKHSSSSSESCCGCDFQAESSRDAPAVLNCITPEAKVTTPKASRQDTGLCCQACSSDRHQAKRLLKEEEVCLDPSGPGPKKATWQPLAAAPLLSMSPAVDPSTSAMQSEILEKAQAAKTEAVQKAEIAAKLVAKAQRFARIAKAAAGARHELQRSASAAASSFHRDGSHQKSLSRTASVSQPYAASTRRVHSKTRAGAAACATRQADQALSAGDDIPDTQQQQQQQQQQQKQQQPWMSASPKHSSSECSTMFSALRHAHAGSKRSQEAACLLTADARHTPFKSHCVDFMLPSSPAQAGSCNRGHAFTSQAAEAAKVPALGLHAGQAPKGCNTPALERLPPCSPHTMDPDCQHGNSCYLQDAHCPQSCHPGLHAHMHRQSSSLHANMHRQSSSRSLACGWPETEADVSRRNSDSSGSTTVPAYVRSAPWVEEDTHHSAGSLLSGPCHAQQLDRQPSAHPRTSASAAALCQQHQLHMIDLMLARVSAAQEAIQLGVRQPEHLGQHCKEQNNLWVPVESCNQLLNEMESSTPVEDNFCGVESLLLCSQQAECNEEQVPVMGDCESKSCIQGASSVYRDTPDDMLEECSERTHSSSGSSRDCPGLSFVPKDWLIDSNDEVDLGFFSAVPSDGIMLGLPLMPQSLQT